MQRIAIIEDNPDNRLLLTALLEDDYDLVLYDNGVDALRHLPEELPQLVLLDISLPGLDGREVLSRLRRDARLRHLPVIALTAHAMADDRAGFLQLGFDDYVAKPILDEEILLDSVERLLKQTAGTRT